MDLPRHLYDQGNRKVAVHYAVTDNKRIIHFGTSRVCGNNNGSKNTIHAEELALKYIHVLTKKKKKKKINKLKILIWRFDKNIEAKQIYCCSSCTKLIKKYKFENNIFTISSSGQLISAITQNHKPSLGNIRRHRDSIKM